MAVAEVFGAEPAWFSEIDDAPSKTLAHHWPTVPNLGDITKIDWGTVEPVDVLTGGFPCQDVSLAGKRAGLTPDSRSGLWTHMAYAIEQLRPRYVVAENVRGLLSAEAHSDVEPCPWCLGDGSGEHSLRALGAVLGDLADLGYDAEWCGLRAAAVGAPHGRFRIFILAEDADQSARGERGFATPGQTQGGRAWPDTGRRNRASIPDTAGHGRDEGWPESARELGRPHAAVRRNAAASAGLAGATAAYAERGRWDGWSPDPIGGQVGRTPPTGSSAPTEWAEYEPAIHRWERITGRLAPAPTQPSAKGAQRLSPRFVEWMMGLPAGHVTGVPGLKRNDQLKALGNGVVPQQATAALRHMLEQMQAVA